MTDPVCQRKTLSPRGCERSMAFISRATLLKAVTTAFAGYAAFPFSKEQVALYSDGLHLQDEDWCCSVHLAELFMHAVLCVVRDRVSNRTLESLQADATLEDEIDNLGKVTLVVISTLDASYSGAVLLDFAFLLSFRWDYWYGMEHFAISQFMINPKVEESCQKTPKEPIVSKETFQELITAVAALTPRHQQELTTLLEPLFGERVCAFHLEVGIARAIRALLLKKEWGAYPREVNLEFAMELLGALFEHVAICLCVEVNGYTRVMAAHTTISSDTTLRMQEKEGE